SNRIAFHHSAPLVCPPPPARAVLPQLSLIAKRHTERHAEAKKRHVGVMPMSQSLDSASWRHYAPTGGTLALSIAWFRNATSVARTSDNWSSCVCTRRERSSKTPRAPAAGGP